MRGRCEESESAYVGLSTRLPYVDYGDIPRSSKVQTPTDAKTYIGKRKIAGASAMAKTLLGLLGAVSDAKANFLLKVETLHRLGGSNRICIHIYIYMSSDEESCYDPGD